MSNSLTHGDVIVSDNFYEVRCSDVAGRPLLEAQLVEIRLFEGEASDQPKTRWISTALLQAAIDADDIVLLKRARFQADPNDWVSSPTMPCPLSTRGRQRCGKSKPTMASLFADGLIFTGSTLINGASGHVPPGTRTPENGSADDSSSSPPNF